MNLITLSSFLEGRGTAFNFSKFRHTACGLRADIASDIVSVFLLGGKGKWSD